jgi:hypothetical protein
MRNQIIHFQDIQQLAAFLNAMGDDMNYEVQVSSTSTVTLFILGRNKEHHA